VKLYTERGLAFYYKNNNASPVTGVQKNGKQISKGAAVYAYKNPLARVDLVLEELETRSNRLIERPSGTRTPL